MQSLPFLRYLVLPRSKYSPQHHVYHNTYCGKLRKKIMQTVTKGIKTKGNNRQ